MKGRRAAEMPVRSRVITRLGLGFADKVGGAWPRSGGPALCGTLIRVLIRVPY